MQVVEKLREVWAMCYSWSLTMWLTIFNFKIDIQPRRWQISVVTRTLCGYVVPIVFMPPLEVGGKVCRVKLADSFVSSKLRYSPSQDALVLPESFHLGKKKNLECPWVKVKVDHSTSNFNPLSGSYVSKLLFNLIVFQLKRVAKYIWCIPS